jgi:hypothetical protein
MFYFGVKVIVKHLQSKQSDAISFFINKTQELIQDVFLLLQFVKNMLRKSWKLEVESWELEVGS